MLIVNFKFPISNRDLKLKFNKIRRLFLLYTKTSTLEREREREREREVIIPKGVKMVSTWQKCHINF